MELFKKILLYLVSAYFAYVFIKHGWLKFDPEGFWSSAFIERWGYGEYFMYFIGVCEFGGGMALLIPKINKYGAALLSVVMLGAVITRIIFGTSIDDVISILFNLIVLLCLSVEGGIANDINRIWTKRSKLTTDD